MTLSRARILVADDQRDVARTLTAQLRTSASAISYVTDGEAAIERMEKGGVDLLLLDMKMPPDDWGGLWALGKMAQLELKVPVIVLSGEGGQKQTIQAMRLGASDWVDKDAAGRELLDRCADVLRTAHQEAIQSAPRFLPTPVAQEFARYLLATEDRSATEGLRVFEGAIRFAGLLALACRAGADHGIPGVQPTQFARPSLGTWMSVARALTANDPSETPAASWLAALIPDSKAMTPAQELVKLRNDIAHGGYEPSPSETEALHGYVSDVAHRLITAWPWRLHVVEAMEYDGASFCVQSEMHAGVGGAAPATFMSSMPLRTGDVMLVKGSDVAIPMSPWMEVVDANGQRVVATYDSAPSKRHADTSTPLRYADAGSRMRGLLPIKGGATWGDIQHHFGRP